MKSFFSIVLITTTSFIFAQNGTLNKSSDITVDANNTANTNALETIAGGTLGGRQFTGAATFYNPKFDREGSVYLFDYWDNNVTVYAKNNAGYFRTENINFNAQRSMFESKRNDSIKGWNFARIDRINVNGRNFKSYYYEPLEREKIFEVIFENNEFAILKGYTVRILDANPNPMVGRLRDKVIKDETYYLNTSEGLQEFKFKKRNILKVLGDKSAQAEEYARKYKKSFSNEEDLKTILNYTGRQETK